MTNSKYTSNNEQNELRTTYVEYGTSLCTYLVFYTDSSDTIPFDYLKWKMEKC
uniref:Uncharacterized protein n=1 Tax=Onchocerca volvulus TaxID=6282 RepID=A0A8R1XMU8_ONCVO